MDDYEIKNEKPAQVEFEHWQDMAPPLMPTGKLEEQLKEYRALKLKVFDSNNNVLRNPLVLDELDQAIENASAVTYEEIPKEVPRNYSPHKGVLPADYHYSKNDVFQSDIQKSGFLAPVDLRNDSMEFFNNDDRKTSTSWGKVAMKTSKNRSIRASDQQIPNILPLIQENNIGNNEVHGNTEVKDEQVSGKDGIDSSVKIMLVPSKEDLSERSESSSNRKKLVPLEEKVQLKKVQRQ